MKAQFVKFQFLADPGLMWGYEYSRIGALKENFLMLKVDKTFNVIFATRGKPNWRQLCGWKNFKVKS